MGKKEFFSLVMYYINLKYILIFLKIRWIKIFAIKRVKKSIGVEWFSKVKYRNVKFDNE